jgi:hypothetical protein
MRRARRQLRFAPRRPAMTRLAGRRTRKSALHRSSACRPWLHPASDRRFRPLPIERCIRPVDHLVSRPRSVLRTSRKASWSRTRASSCSARLRTGCSLRRSTFPRRRSCCRTGGDPVSAVDSPQVCAELPVAAERCVEAPVRIEAHDGEVKERRSTTLLGARYPLRNWSYGWSNRYASSAPDAWGLR